MLVGVLGSTNLDLYYASGAAELCAELCVYYNSNELFIILIEKILSLMFFVMHQVLVLVIAWFLIDKKLLFELKAYR